MAPHRRPPSSPPCTAWAAATAEITPLGHPKPNTPKTPKLPAPTGPQTGPKTAPLVPKPMRTTPYGHTHWRTTPLTISSNTAQCLAGHAPHTPKAHLKALSLGHILPQATLDLHGLHEGDAWLRLHHFLTEAARTEVHGQPITCVLVIHGKGKGQGVHKDMGILKSQMAAQLARHPHVVAFHTALPQHGGQGATYALLHSL